MVITLENFELVKYYLFGSTKFLDFLLILMLIDIITGVSKAIKNKNLFSKSAFIGYLKKISIFAVIITSNLMDQMLNLSGMLADATLMFYVFYEITSILENSAELGLPVPKIIQDKLKVIEQDSSNGDEK
jgi:toxin secretion/phage lysis holin